MHSKEKVVDVPSVTQRQSAEVERSKVQFLNRVDDVQVVLTMKALVRAWSGTVVQGVDGGC